MFLRMSAAKRPATPCLISNARAQHLNSLKMSQAKAYFLEDQRRNTTPPASPLCDDVSGEMLLHSMLDILYLIHFLRLSTASASFFQNKRRTTTFPTSPFCEDVLGEMPSQTILDIRRPISII